MKWSKLHMNTDVEWNLGGVGYAPYKQMQIVIHKPLLLKICQRFTYDVGMSIIHTVICIERCQPKIYHAMNVVQMKNVGNIYFLNL